MFCPNCGKSSQILNTYCRQCGVFLPDYSDKKRSFTLGGDTPEEQIRGNLVLNFLSGMVSLILAIALFATFRNQPNTPQIIYVAATFLLVMCGWQFSTFRVGLKLKKTFDRRKSAPADENIAPPNEHIFPAATTRELLNEPDLSSVVPAGSVTEQTTRNLTKKESL